MFNQDKRASRLYLKIRNENECKKHELSCQCLRMSMGLWQSCLRMSMGLWQSCFNILRHRLVVPDCRQSLLWSVPIVWHILPTRVQWLTRSDSHTQTHTHTHTKSEWSTCWLQWPQWPSRTDACAINHAIGPCFDLQSIEAVIPRQRTGFLFMCPMHCLGGFFAAFSYRELSFGIKGNESYPSV